MYSMISSNFFASSSKFKVKVVVPKARAFGTRTVPWTVRSIFHTACGRATYRYRSYVKATVNCNDKR